MNKEWGLSEEVLNFFSKQNDMISKMKTEKVCAATVQLSNGYQVGNPIKFLDDYKRCELKHLLHDERIWDSTLTNGLFGRFVESENELTTSFGSSYDSDGCLTPQSWKLEGQSSTECTYVVSIDRPQVHEKKVKVEDGCCPREEKLDVKSKKKEKKEEGKKLSMKKIYRSCLNLFKAFDKKRKKKEREFWC